MKLKLKGKPVKQGVKKGDKHLVTRTYASTNVDYGDFQGLKQEIKRVMFGLINKNQFEIGESHVQVLGKIQNEDEHSFWVSGKLHVPTSEQLVDLKVPNISVKNAMGSFDNIALDTFMVQQVILNII